MMSVSRVKHCAGHWEFSPENNQILTEITLGQGEKQTFMDSVIYWAVPSALLSPGDRAENKGAFHLLCSLHVAFPALVGDER